MSADPAEVEAATNAETPPTPDGSAEPKQTAESAPAVKGADEKGKTDGFTRRIDELTRDFRSTERELAAERRERQALEVELQRLRPKPEPEFIAKTLADFQYDEAKYQSYLFGEAQNRAVQAAEDRLRQAQESAERESRVQSFAEREQEYAAKVPDYFDVTRSDRVSISDTMAETIMDSEKGPEIAHHLAMNPRLAAQISRLSPLQQAREIGRIEAKLDKAPVVPKVSEAPPPAPKVEATGDAGTSDVKPDSPESDKLPADVWLRRRNKQLDRKRT